VNALGYDIDRIVVYGGWTITVATNNFLLSRIPSWVIRLHQSRLRMILIVCRGKPPSATRVTLAETAPIPLAYRGYDEIAHFQPSPENGYTGYTE
jgi:hypothetical protein